ncbi:MAG: glycosyltransferase family 39 protein [Candidatus Omnitrophica bacterium]|nr:glycosyltransferase family 39 protein [Candidatus Omnitrophota bacterium]
MIKAGNLKNVLILTVLAFCFLMLGNHMLSQTNPDEVFYSGSAKEMMQQNTWEVPILFGKPQFEKPIFTFWLLRFGFELFGISNFSARFFPALFAIMGVIAVYLLVLLGAKSEKNAFICGGILSSAGLYIGMSRTVFTDMIFTVLILLSLVAFFWAYVNSNRKFIGVMLFFVFSALAVLTKGPLGFFIPLLAVILFLLFKKDLKFLFCGSFGLGFLVFLLISVPWYALMIKKYGREFIDEFFYNDHIRRVIEAEHKGNDTWYFYPMTMILCMFPWSLFVLASIAEVFMKALKKTLRTLDLFLISWIIVVFVVFQAAHSKLTSYILPLFPALAVLAGDFIYRKLTDKPSLLVRLMQLSSVLFLILPIGLVVNSFLFSMYLPPMAFVYSAVFILVFLIFFIFLSASQKKLLVSLFLTSLIVPILLIFTFSWEKHYRDYVSCKNVGAYILNELKVDNTILCTKAYARGVRFYTDKPVAVINVGGRNFFSAHPIGYFDTDEKTFAFLKTQPVTYGVIKKSCLVDIERIAGKEFKVELLKTFGNEYVVKVTAINQQGKKK